MARKIMEADAVSRIIGHCVADPRFAEETFNALTVAHNHRVDLPDGESCLLTDEEVDEFAVRYSSEVEPTIWVSKRLKY